MTDRAVISDVDDGERWPILEYIDRLDGVYVIALSDEGPTKIGLALDAKRRVSNMQVGNPYRLWLADLVLMDAPSAQAAMVERSALRTLRECGFHIRGEWF